MSDRPTPETDAATLNKWQDSCPLQVVPKSLAVALERQRDELLEALYTIDERFIDGCDTYDDWQFMGQTARAAIAAVKGGEG
jgi:hypothetical protein